MGDTTTSTNAAIARVGLYPLATSSSSTITAVFHTNTLNLAFRPGVRRGPLLYVVWAVVAARLTG